MRKRSLWFLLPALLFAPSGHGGDPVPDVDVTVEQIPGAGFTFESLAGGFDQVEIGGGRSFVEGLTPKSLPAGWTLSRKGRKAVLEASPGTPTDRPVRFRLEATARLDGGVDWDVSLAGRSLAKAKDAVPRQVPPFKVKNQLDGLVYLPEEVRAGETLSFRPASAELPPGRFMLSGEVVDEFPENEWKAAMAQVNNTRSNIKGRAAELPPAGVLLTSQDGDSCTDLAGLAAALALAPGGPAASYQVARGAGGAPTASYVVMKPGGPNDYGSRRDKHQKAVMDFVKGIVAVSPDSGNEDISIKEKGIDYTLTGADQSLLRISIKEQGGGISIKEEGIEISIKEQGIEIAGPAEPRFATLSGEATAAGCRFTSREPSDLELVRLTRSATSGSPPPVTGTPGSLQGTVYAADVPANLPPGAGLAIQFIDRFGDILVDVPRAPVEVLPTRPAGQALPVPCIESATAYVQPADAVCVCGSFPNPSAAWGLLLDERPLPDGAILSTSSSTVWLRLPETTRPGRHFLSGPADAGFAPSCRATTQRIEISGAIDSNRLLRGESVPMRLTVVGTTDAIPLRLRNLTPTVIAIDGGTDQTAATSGGGVNILERQVRALERGAFNVEWTLTTPPCPCANPR